MINNKQDLLKGEAPFTFIPYSSGTESFSGLVEEFLLRDIDLTETELALEGCIPHVGNNDFAVNLIDAKNAEKYMELAMLTATVEEKE